MKDDVEILDPNTRVRKPSSAWKGRMKDDTKLFYTKPSVHGQNYMCKVCGKRNLGIGRHNHWKTCPHHPDNRKDV